MDSVFDDGSKTWASVTNKLYAQTSPCLILQDVVNPGKVSAASDGNDMRPTEVLVEVIWGVPLHGVTVVDVVGEMILGKTQHKDTVEFLVRTDGWACYKWPKNRAPGQWFGKWYVNDHSHIRAHRKTQETWFKTKDPSLHDRGWRRTCRGLGSLEYSRCVREYRSVWKSTSVSGAPNNSPLSHFTAMTRPRWLRRAVSNRHRHAIEQASHRWRGGRREDSARTRRTILISTQVPLRPKNLLGEVLVLIG